MIDLNTDPYYDDFDESKGFYKILFRPGFAVQARELTQLQTALQNQVTRFGEHIFKDGSIVLNGNTFTSSVYYIKVTSLNVTDFNGTVITGDTSGAKAKVVAVSNNIDGTTSKIYFTYTNGLRFAQNEGITADSGDTVDIVNVNAFIGTATAFSIDDSVFFVNGHFVFCNSQTEIIGEDDTPISARVGLLVEEGVVTPSEDESLLDPARGTFNFSAPGANRYTITLTLTSYAYTQSDTDTDNASAKFIELARYVDGVAVYINKFPIYSEIENTLARRTFDESGDYTVKAFGLKVEDHIRGDNTLLSLKVEPGKAYIRGYEYETIAPTFIDLAKARTAIFNNEFPVTISYGQYVYIKDPLGSIDYSANPTANVYNSNSFNDANVIGTARIKHVVYDSTTGGVDTYKLYIDTVSLGSNAIATIRGIGTGDNALAGHYLANVDTSKYDSNIVTLSTADTPAYLVNLPKNYVANVTAAETSYESIRVITGTTFTTNTVLAFAGPITISSPHQFDAGKPEEDYIITVTARSAGTIPIGYRLDPDNYTIEYVTGTSINISYTGPYSTNSTFTATVTAPTSVTSPTFKTKTLASGSKIITGGANIAHWANLIVTSTLSKSDIFRLTDVLVYDDQANVFTYNDFYDLNNGQSDIEYSHGSVTLKTGYISPAFDYANVRASIYTGATGNISNVTFNFEYFTHTGEGVLTVNSYNGSGVPYEDIPSYTASTGEIFNLRNCFDFRPRQADGGTSYTSGSFGAPGTRIVTDFYNYVGRKARLVLTKERIFTLIDGIADEYPAVPLDVPDSMTLYLLDIPPYTLNKEEVTFQYIDNRRYTMRDIGRIERRIEKLEYYTALSLLEKVAKDENIIDAGTTLDRFKNGILVDSFAGHSVGDVSNEKYLCSIDYENRILRPRHSSQSFNFKLNTGTNYSKRGDLITNTYTTDTFLNQPLASTWVNLNPYNVFNWNGVMTLNPATDTWVDTYVKPDVTVNLNGENDVFTQLVPSVDNPASTGVRWNDWQTIINGTPQITNNLSTSSTVSTQTTAGGQVLQTTTTTTTNNQTTTVTDQVARVGLEISTGATRTITRDLGSRVVDTSIVPYIRSRVVDFAAKGLKPTTQVIATFDGIDVTEYCTPATEIKITGTIPANANKIQLSANASIEGRILMIRPDRVFVNMREGLIYEGNAVTFLQDTTSLGTATANTITYSTVDQTITGNVVLTTNEVGDLAGSFLIPSTDTIRFRTGEREFRLTDFLGKEASTAAATKYIAQGLSQSTERTLVATRVASVAVNPVFDTKSVTSTTSQSIVVGTETTVVDITPPPPPPSVPCGDIVTGSGRRGRFTYNLNFGTDIGSCGINYNAFTVPDRYTIIWNGNEYTTGFVGSSNFNNQLRALGFPNVTGPGSGQLRFNKTLASPSIATLIVDAPLQGTAWRFSSVCPASNVAPTPVITPSYRHHLHANPLTFAFNENAAAGSTGRIDLHVHALDKGARGNAVRYTLTTTGGTLGTATLSSRSRTDADRERRWADSTRRTTLTLTRPSVAGRQSNVTVTSTAEWFTDSTFTTSLGVTDVKSVNIRYIWNTNPPRIDPVAQTFFVDAVQYPNGLFVDSIDLYFRSKATDSPVTVQLRPTVNGYPSSKDIMPFSVVSLLPSQVNTSTDGSAATNFRFDSPVYLSPGEYSFVALCNTTEYEIYTARIGDALITDPDVRITSQPAIGSMFKSQNSSTWTPIQEEDVKFKLNKCVFDTTTTAEITLDTDIPSSLGTVEYDVFYASGETIDFAATDIEYYYKSTDTGNNVDSFVRYQSGSNVTMSERKHVRSSNPSDLQYQVKLSTTDSNISPVIDINRLSTVLVQNIINNVSTNETTASDGDAIARYITRKVTLAPNFESLDLKAYLLANIPTSTSIKVYYKVASLVDPFFEDNAWQEMVIESAGTASENGWVEYKYKTSTDTALTNGDRFKIFALKIVMLSSDTTRVPQIRDLRVIALDD